VSSNSREPNPHGSEKNEAKKVDGRFFIARGGPPILLELAEETFHEVPLLVEVEVGYPRVLSVRPWRDDDVHPFGRGSFDNFVGVITFVRDEVLAFCGLDERWGFDNIVDVSGGEVDMGWITETVHESVDFCGKASARASNTLIEGPPFPPAACWWTRTYEASAMLDSLSASRESTPITFSKTPCLFHRVNRVCTVFHGPKRSGRSRHGTPVLAT